MYNSHENIINRAHHYILYNFCTDSLITRRALCKYINWILTRIEVQLFLGHKLIQPGQARVTKILVKSDPEFLTVQLILKFSYFCETNN